MQGTNSAIICLFIVLTACNQSGANKTKVTSKPFNWEQREWKSKQVVQFFNDFQYRATEVPTEYYVLKSSGGSTINQLDSIAHNFEQERVIEFEFEHSAGTDILEKEFTKRPYDEAVLYMASTIQRDYTVVTSSNDTIPCTGVLFERNLNVAPFKRLLLFFGNISPEENLQLIYNDRLFDNGLFKFKFDEIPFKT